MVPQSKLPTDELEAMKKYIHEVLEEVYGY
jgi:hypothetical protein